ncbi:PREDICTED: 39S ribosomal protein L28, mitochondrial [Dipodomys ordii]|uniref:Large ribosomal subunit protein bL28m n=1 Tax=Dipodomys ordii TaxID=10020 RepID=A0A1S3ETK3_DIPOR|nr:PREDICTED: 39S ribosomal protein L28, mitochondrial [Dipodomys ordii]
MASGDYRHHVWGGALCSVVLGMVRMGASGPAHREGPLGPVCPGRDTLTESLLHLQLSARVKKVWKPQLLQRELYSEILDKKFTVTVTMRTLDLIDKAYGFDFYILKTPKEDLCSKFGMDLKRGMLLRLARQDPQLHPDDPERRAAIYSKYKDFAIPEAEAEWVGLTLEEAVEKQRLLEEKDPVPLFKIYVEELVEQLRQQVLSEPAVVQKTASGK